jgi:hypothetical protein
MNIFSKLFGKHPSESEILNVAMKLAKERGLQFRQPIQNRLFKKYPFLDKDQLDNYNVICKTVLNDGISFINNSVMEFRKQKRVVERDELENLFNDHMLKKYPWMDKANLSGVFNHVGYYGEPNQPG